MPSEPAATVTLLLRAGKTGVPELPDQYVLLNRHIRSLTLVLVRCSRTPFRLASWVSLVP